MTENDNKEKAKKLNALIDALNVCSESKLGIKKLVGEIVGVNIEPPTPKSMSIVIGGLGKNLWIDLGPEHGDARCRCLFPLTKEDNAYKIGHQGALEGTDRFCDIKNITVVERSTGEERVFYNANME